MSAYTEHLDFWESLDNLEERERTISQFSQEEIIIPQGPFAGQYYSLDTQPIIRHYFAAIESGLYQRFAVVGPTQSGKTLSGSVIPTLYQLFECGDNVVFGAPTIDIAKDKWQKDFAPVISRTRYKSLMPIRGTGARGGSPSGINFLNGASLRFMTGGAGDKGVAGYTARVIAVTEVDGMDESQITSREADRISQLEVRGDAFGLSKRVYLECTASIPEGRIWQEYLNGTHTTLEKPCQYCGEWVIPERDHIKGWRECESERAVLDAGYFQCPACEHPWTEKERVEMVHNARATVNNPDSLTYSFRWNAFDNLFWTPAEIALDEWRAAHRQEHEKEQAEKVQAQFKWATPYTPPPPPDMLTIETLDRSIAKLHRGIVPEWAEFITAGVDVGKWLLHWVVMAWNQQGRGHVVDYGISECPTDDVGEERGIELAANQIHDRYETGYQQAGHDKALIPAIRAMDARYLPDVVIRYCKTHRGWWPAEGQGASQGQFGRRRRLYSAPRTTHSKTVVQIGEQYHVARDARGRDVVAHNVDWGKMYLHRALQAPPDNERAITIFEVMHEAEHLQYLKHLTSEQLLPDPKTGELKWQKLRDSNHFLDATILAMLAARIKGVQPGDVVPTEAQTAQAPRGDVLRELANAKIGKMRRRY